MNKIACTLLLLLLMAVFAASNAAARLDGAVEWGYANYTESNDGEKDKTASHFTQRYSVMNNMQGLISGGRGGFYDFGVGAEWAAFDTEIDNGVDGTKTIDNDAFKLLYQGRVQLAPGGLPFRLNAYSYDTNQITFDRGGSEFYRNSNAGSLIPVYNRNPFGLVRPGIVTDLSDGQTIISGVQFMAGIRNGSYLGQYREILSRWPRILVDYRDVYRRDMTSFTPEKYRDRNLAFVSLNKKDNWFHYRIFKHKDYLRDNRDSQEDMILLGTIDHTMKRQWINLTNWIRISIDGSFSKISRDQDLFDENRFDLNFFTSLRRRAFAADSLVNLQRVKRGGLLENTLDAPVFASKHLNPNTSVRGSFQIWKDEKSRDDGRYNDRDDQAYYSKVLFEMHKRSRVQVDPSLEVETRSGDAGDGNAIRGKVEAYSNRNNRERIAWHGMGSLAYFDGNSELDDKADMWESELQSDLGYDLRPNLNVGAIQNFLIADGSFGSQVNRYIYSQAAMGFSRNGALRRESVEDNSLFRSASTLYVEHTSSSRVNNRFQLYYKFQDSDDGNLDTLELSHQLRYQTRAWTFKVENFYVTGDDADYNGPGSSYLGNVVDASPYEHQFMHRSRVDFSPNRYWSNKLDTRITLGKGYSGETNKLFQVEQELKRNFFSRYSVRRKLADVTQSLVYEQFQDGIDKRATIFSLAGTYYPTRFWRIGARAMYSDFDFASNTLVFNLMTGVDFPLFHVDFSYDYGTADNDLNTVAHRYEVNVRKTF